MRVCKNEKISNRHDKSLWDKNNNDKDLSEQIGRFIRNSFPKNYTYRCIGKDNYFGPNWFTLRVTADPNRILIGIFRDTERKLPKNIKPMKDKFIEWEFDGNLTNEDLNEIKDTVMDYLKMWNPDDEEMMAKRVMQNYNIPVWMLNNNRSRTLRV